MITNNAVDRFNPALLSDAENEFVLEFAGKPVIIAMREHRAGVNPVAVRPLLERIAELEQVKQYSGHDWAGLAKLKETITTYLSQSRKWSADKRKGAPRWPSMHTYSSKGKAILGATGADGGIIQSYFANDGTRKSFILDLVPEELPEWMPEWSQADVPTGGITRNDELNLLECFCGHREMFKADNRGSYAAARARMGKHLRSTTEDLDRHREVYAVEYNS